MKPGKRLLSLDAFRGLTIAGMILVNTPGSWGHVYPPLLHAKWHGCTPTDLVFPFFLFIVGVSMWFSFKKLNHQLSPESFRKLAKRAALIFLIGLFMNIFPFFTTSIETFRIMGVLQRIAVAFFFGAILCLSVPTRWLPIVLGIVLLGYWGILAAFGGLDPYSLEGNFAKSVDLAILSEGHMYKGFGIPFDPEGLMSSLPAIGTVIIGFLVGRMIETSTNISKAIRALVGFGILAIVLAVLWHQVFPINKPLWTSSYVLYTAGIACILLSIFLWMIEFKGWKQWASPLVVLGLNPLFIYALSIIWVKIMLYILKWDQHGTMTNGYSWLYRQIFVPMAGDLNGSLLFAISHVAVFWFIAWLLWKRKIFIKV